jgi:hypothetical protein
MILVQRSATRRNLIPKVNHRVQRLADQQKAPLVLTKQYSISHLTPPDGPVSEILLPPQLA